MFEEVLKNRKLNIDKLLPFGFQDAGNSYVFQADIADGQMKLTVVIDTDEKIYTKITDNASGDEYVLHRVAGAAGSFVGRVKGEYEAVLDEISNKCFMPDVFKSKQAKEIIDYVRKTYGDEPEYLWKKFPDNAVVRRKDNEKWYAALLTVSGRKLGFDSDEKVEVLDLRMKPEDIEKKVDGARFLPGYHMNKKHWITICLDSTVPTQEIYALINESYALAIK